MAAGNSNYERGTMGVSEHRKTFGGFMGLTVYGGAAMALIVIYPILVFGVKMGWLPSAWFWAVRLNLRAVGMRV